MTDARLLAGIGVSPGIAVGPVVVVRWGLPDVPHRAVPPEAVEGEVRRLRESVAVVRRSLEELRERARERLGPEEANIFEAQLLMLQDEEFLGGVERLIRDNQLTAERAFEFKALEMRALWANSASMRLRQRLADLSGIQMRVLQYLMGETHEESLHQADGRPAIVLTHELTPGLTMQFERGHVVGFASEEGTRTSHAAILARSLGIPCVMGVVGGLARIADGTEVILDGTAGTLLMEPTGAEITMAQTRETRRRRLLKELERVVGQPAATTDGITVAIRGNLDLPEELDQVVDHGAEGVGLLRTEFLITGRADLPSEEEQAEYFARVARRFPGHPVVVRSYDIGGDKFPAAFRIVPEANPFLGWRALRVCLDHPEVFRTQLRALLRARLAGDIHLMLPLVIDVAEVEAARELVGEAGASLAGDGLPSAEELPVGVMVETPAAVRMVDRLVAVSDFLSVGTNDLTQYTLAVDRGNARLAGRFNPFHPAVVRMLKDIRDAGEEAGKPTSVCGEMASDPLGAFLLLGLGYRVLSASPVALPLVRWLVRQVSGTAAREAADAALAAPRAEDVTHILTEGIARHVDPEMLDPGRLPTTSSDTTLQ